MRKKYRTGARGVSMPPYAYASAYAKDLRMRMGKIGSLCVAIRCIKPCVNGGTAQHHMPLRSSGDTQYAYARAYAYAYGQKET